MITKKLDSFKVIGIAIRTTNENNQAAKDIPALWNTFMSQEIISKIPNKVDESIYAIYTEYESDYTKPYTTILGCKVEHTDVVPEGMVTTTIQHGNYSEFVATGDLYQNVVVHEWQKIWNDTSLDRTYKTDFEIYGPEAKDHSNAKVPIYVGIQ
ncbi:GyrI-like domain-containing protein [Aquimarina algicola]|uniref:AraC family transcriptional regulator n=1 Tax=Aquimarina algicola TaxID=2589995 RepID=A0A504JDE1_9FLAO|nr:effector binding domain-containing protein [Aquimarina algicola]TPN84590.1 AraC family transcriptional regulator [Aquimarina algicola]